MSLNKSDYNLICNTLKKDFEKNTGIKLKFNKEEIEFIINTMKNNEDLSEVIESLSEYFLEKYKNKDKPETTELITFDLKNNEPYSTQIKPCHLRIHHIFLSIKTDKKILKIHVPELNLYRFIKLNKDQEEYFIDLGYNVKLESNVINFQCIAEDFVDKDNSCTVNLMILCQKLLTI